MATKNKATINKTPKKEVTMVNNNKPAENYSAEAATKRGKKIQEAKAALAAKVKAKDEVTILIKKVHLCESTLREAFANPKYPDTFDFAKLKNKNVIKMFTNPNFVKIIYNLNYYNLALTEYEGKYPGIVEEAKQDLIETEKAAKEAAKQAAIAERVAKDAITSKFSAEELEAMVKAYKASKETK